jgi:DegV family protein with EDD domain
VWAAAQAARAGLSAAQCTAIAQRAVENSAVFVYVPSIEYFVRGGRVSPLQGRIAKLLRLLPVLTVMDGKLVPAAKVIGRRAAQKRAIRSLLKAAHDFLRPMFVISHSAAPALAEKVKSTIQRSYPESQIWITDTTPAIGSHAGPGGLGMAVLDAGLIEAQIAEEVAA